LNEFINLSIISAYSSKCFSSVRLKRVHCSFVTLPYIIPYPIPCEKPVDKLLKDRSLEWSQDYLEFKQQTVSEMWGAKQDWFRTLF